MNLHALLRRREADSHPIRLALIGAGKFGSMYLAQAQRTPGIHVAALLDLEPERARQALARVGWPEAQYGAASLDAAIGTGGTWVADNVDAVFADGRIEVVIDATGDPAAGIRHALRAAETDKHIVMVNVEADALAGPLLAARAREAGVVYSLAYGDQPALIAEQVDWARTAGFDVVAAGKGTKYLPHYHAVTPDDVWDHYGLTPEQAADGGLNPQMFNSFLDGTKSAIEMAAVANATGLTPAPDGLGFPPASVDELAEVCRPAAEGGALHHKGQVEVVSSLRRDGEAIERDLRWGIYVTFEGADDYVRRCFAEYGLATDSSGRYAAMYKPYHLIGLELGISVASVALRNEPTGAPGAFHADAVAVAKCALRKGEILDGEGGYTVWGKLMPAADSIGLGGLPIGLAHGVPVTRDIAAGEPVRWDDVALDEDAEAVGIRREMERLFRPGAAKAAE